MNIDSFCFLPKYANWILERRQVKQSYIKSSPRYNDKKNDIFMKNQKNEKVPNDVV